MDTLTAPPTPDGSEGGMTITWGRYRTHALQKLQLETTLNSGEYIRIGSSYIYGPVKYTLDESTQPYEATIIFNGNTTHTFTIKGRQVQTGYGPIHEGLPDFEQYIGRTEYYAPDPLTAKIYVNTASTTFVESSYAYDSLAYVAVQPSLVNNIYGASDTVTPRSFATLCCIKY